MSSVISLDLGSAAVQTALRSFLVGILPSTVPVIAAQVNRTPSPRESDYVVVNQIRKQRLSTNIDTYADCLFIASLDDVTLTVSAVAFGVIGIGNQLFGVNVLSNTTVVAQTSGPTGGEGTYTVSKSQTVASEAMATGVQNLLQPTQTTYQLDVHGPSSGDNAQIISTLFRDEFATSFFATVSPKVYPLHADEPRQLPFITGEAQWDNRWIIEATLQANSSVVIPQQFAGVVNVGLIDVDVVYPG